MAISGIGSIFSAIGMANPAQAAQGTQAAGATPGADAAGAAGATNNNAFANALDGLQSAQDNADGLAVQAATGSLVDVHNYTIAATEAQLMTDLTVAVRDRAVESFNEIMRMQA